MLGPPTRWVQNPVQVVWELKLLFVPCATGVARSKWEGRQPKEEALQVKDPGEEMLIYIAPKHTCHATPPQDFADLVVSME